MENNHGIDIDQPVRDTDGDRGIEMDVAAEVGRIFDRRVERDDFDENAKKILNNIVKRMKDPVNLEAVKSRNVDRKKLRRKKTQAVNQVLAGIHTESITETNLVVLVGTIVFSELARKKRRYT